MTTTHYVAHARDSRVLELPEEAKALGIQPGEAVSVSVEREEEHPSTSVPYEAGLAALRDVARIKKGMRETDGSQTDRIIREGRAGGMYGIE